MTRHARAVLLTFSAGVLVTTRCGGTESAAPASPPLAAGCTPSQSVMGGPILDPRGPYYHQVVVAHTTDGRALTGAHQIIDHASVPDGVRRTDGTVLIYYVNGNDGGVWVARFEGDTARVLGPITLNGVANPAGVVDPDVLTQPDGRVRLTFFGGFGPPTDPNAQRAMCIADSSDGIAFTSRATALTFLTSEMLTDPSLVRLADGSWLMAISHGQNTLIARSADGLTFTREATLAYGGVPEIAIATDGALRLYVCAGGIESYRSTDAGHAWTREGNVIGPGFNGKPIVCDPSLVAGAGLFVFKTGQ
jgi:hypothetical protein